MIVFNQNYYPNLEVDDREKDIISVWMNGTALEETESNVIMIERKNIDAFCQLLKKCNEKTNV